MRAGTVRNAWQTLLKPLMRQRKRRPHCSLVGCPLTIPFTG